MRSAPIALVVLVALAGLAGCGPRAVASTPPVAPASDVPPATPAERDHDSEDLGELLASIRAEHHVPGLAAAVVSDAGVIAIGVAGRRRSDRPEPLTTGDAFHLGSDTKAMTAMLVGRLVEQGKVRWDDRVEALFPDAASFMHGDWSGVTLLQLLSHRSGASPDAILAYALAAGGGRSPDAGRKAVARATLARPPDHAPGSAFQYSNLGYIVAGAAIEHATSETWEALITREVFEPLGMEGCGFGPVATDQRPAAPWAHLPAGDDWTPTSIDNVALLGPAGTVHCPLEAWARFARAQWEVGAAAIISADTRARLHEGIAIDDERGAYALGWLVVTDPHGRRLLTHDGSNTANYASIAVFPDARVAVLVACNAGGEKAQAAVQAARAALVDRFM